MARTSITPENVYSIVANKNFNKFRIRIAKSGNIKIELVPARDFVSHLYGSNDIYGSAVWTSKPIEYTIGYTSGIGYWLRRQGESGFTFPLHYDRNTGKYGFETFEDAANHLEKLFIKKYL